MKKVILNEECETITSYEVIGSNPHATWSYEPKPIPKKLSGCLQPAATLGFLTGVLMLAFGKSETEAEAIKWHPSNISKQRKDYVERFKKVAQEEYKRYGVPASVTLGQGILESAAGTSKLATQNNNHFGVKCFSKNCSKGHCTNFKDDSHKDFFRKYQSPWESFRDHSLKLNNPRYKSLKRKAKNYKDWANGLENCGYATDEQYAEELITLIEDCDLTFFDK